MAKHVIAMTAVFRGSVRVGYVAGAQRVHHATRITVAFQTLAQDHENNHNFENTLIRLLWQKLDLPDVCKQPNQNQNQQKVAVQMP
jgi:hypothetical protein